MNANWANLKVCVTSSKRVGLAVCADEGQMPMTAFYTKTWRERDTQKLGAEKMVIATTLEHILISLSFLKKQEDYHEFGRHYYDFPETMTELEKRADDDDDLLEKLPRCIWPSIARRREGLDRGDEYEGISQFEITAGGFNKAPFDKRKPAFGWSPAELEEIAEYAAKSEYHEFLIFRELRGDMSKRLICVSGSDLIQILRNEMESGVPAPVLS